VPVITPLGRHGILSGSSGHLARSD